MNERQLALKAAQLRYQILETALKAGKGHVPPAFSWVEIAVTLYYSGILRINPQDPKWDDRDRFILSKGHGCLTLYAILADLGFFPLSELDSFSGDDNMLAAHPDLAIPGIETVSGSLGHGLGISCGLALSAMIDKKDWMTYTILGDGECYEGSVWEAAMFGGHHKLNNLVAIVDRNGLSATDYTENYLTLEPFEERWRSFGWDVVSVDGHSIKNLYSIFSAVGARTSGKPLVVIAKTVKGKGVSFMENSSIWHHQLPKGAMIRQAREELQDAINNNNADFLDQGCGRSDRL